MFYGSLLFLCIGQLYSCGRVQYSRKPNCKQQITWGGWQRYLKMLFFFRQRKFSHKWLCFIQRSDLKEESRETSVRGPLTYFPSKKGECLFDFYSEKLNLVMKFTAKCEIVEILCCAKVEITESREFHKSDSSAT